MVAHEVEACDADPDVARDPEPAKLRLVVVGGVDDVAGDDALGDDPLVAVGIGDERVQRADALGEPALDRLPVGGGDHARDRVDVELEVALDGGEADARTLQRAPDEVGQRRGVRAGHGLEAGAGGGPRQAIRAEAFVEDALAHRIAGEQVIRARGGHCPKPDRPPENCVSTLGPNLISMSVPAVLSIAGSDSGGGAGIQADLKAFARCGVHGMTAITALTAQSTMGVTGIYPVAGDFIVEQVRAVAEDIGVDAVKIGMLGTAETVRAVREALSQIADGVPIVIDPVMVSESGAVLLDDEARAAIVTELLPLATVITPNLPEARVLVAGAGEETGVEAWRAVGGGDDVEDLARALHALGPENVVVTGGHRERIVDVFFDGSTVELLPGERHPDGAAHGSGCTHSSAIAAHLALGFTPLDAARAAREIASEAVRDGHRGIGGGAGPVNVLGVGVRHRTRDRAARGA